MNHIIRSVYSYYIIISEAHVSETKRLWEYTL